MTSYCGAAAVMGWPVAHSKSPIIHQFWLKKLGADGDYGRLAIAPKDLPAAMAALPIMGFKGVNVTVPHKVAVMAHLDHIDETARAVGAVNIIVVGADKRLSGYNSDAAGFAEPLRDHHLQGKKAAIVGAGGATRAIIVALKMLGVEIAAIYNRSPERAQTLVDEFALSSTQIYALDAPVEAVDLLINASSMGLGGKAIYAPDLSALPSSALVYDIVYDPLETALLAQARARDLSVIDGLAMLIGQAAVAFKLFYGLEPPRACDDELRTLLLA